MTRSRSRLKASSAWVILVALVLLTGVANAGRKRIVVLEFEGDKAEKFHEDVVKLIKKSHTVVSVDKWNGAAEEMSATKLTDKNVKKVAKKLKVDGVVSGVVEKRRDEYILRMKLRSGASGELVGSQVNIKSESARIDSTAAKDVKDELIDVIGTLESNREGGGEEEEEEKPKKGGFGKKPAEEEEEEKPKKGNGKKPPVEEEEEKPKKGGFGKKPPVEEEEKPKKGGKKPPVEEEEEKPKKGGMGKKPPVEEEEKPKKGGKKPVEEVAVKAKPSEEEEEETKPKTDPEKPGKRVGKKDDEEETNEITERGEVKTDGIFAPGERAIDAAVGLSFTARRMAFSYTPMATPVPAGYKQGTPAPGLFLDVTAYPLSFGHNRKDILRHLGVTVTFDRVLALNAKNPRTNEKLNSSEQRFAIGAAFRYPLGTAATAPVVGGALRYNTQSFTISGMPAVPNVSYSMLDLGAFFQYPLGGIGPGGGPKMVLGFNAGFLLPLDAGDITKLVNYGRAKITGFEGSVGFDYMLLKNIFARAEGRFETLGYAFKAEGMKSRGVGGARDTYYGGTLTAGYLF